jgi:hypothetical protein
MMCTQVRRIIHDTHDDIGEGKVRARLKTDGGLRIQRPRVREALARCDDIRAPMERRVIVQRAWYDSVAPWFVCCMDQNEKLGKWGFKVSSPFEVSVVG